MFDTHSTLYLDILTAIVAESDEMKELFVNLVMEEYTNQGEQVVVAWVPINEEGHSTGNVLEHQSIMGPFF